MRSPGCARQVLCHRLGVREIFVFDADGKYRRALGSLKGAKDTLNDPPGSRLVVIRAAQRIYASDPGDKSLRAGHARQALQTIGKHGQDQGQFDYPTELHLDHDNLLVVDAMKFRVMVWTQRRCGGMMGQIGDSVGHMFRPEGVAIDRQDTTCYVVDGLRHGACV